MYQLTYDNQPSHVIQQVAITVSPVAYDHMVSSNQYEKNIYVTLSILMA